MSTNARHIRLRALTLEDALVTWQWRNQDEIRNDFSGHPFPVNYEQEKEWYLKILGSNIPTTAFGIEIVSSSQLAGMTFLKNINQLHRQAEFAILVDKAQSGKGYGKEACMQTLQFAFSNLGLHRIFLKVRKDNTAAIKVYTACGFTEEGVLREDVYKQGEFKDVLIMSILSYEFQILDRGKL
ncbi:MAG: GNAT family N-acetyltransferase [Bacteroidetes bacterium]|nr:GNAT family N-acetyltransferase [Bacteroidota bacterium]MBK9543798.1 GNAT family N-acetyltransferase [Bacteroidota bacterium]MBP6402639.1 GNAT family N-acetyltransferase [Bacteroidia bacterium]